MTFQLTWYDANGAATALTAANGVTLTRGAIGLGVAAPTNVIDSYAAFDGMALIGRRRDSQQIVLPLLVKHATRAQTVVSRIASMFQGPGQLQFDDGVDSRTINRVIYNGGLNGDTGNQVSPTWRKVVVSLLALDPWWYGATQFQNLAIGVVTAWDASVAWDAAIPWDGGGTVAVNVDGDTDAYPITVVTGPVTAITVTLRGVGWSLASPLAAGDVLVVDSRPGARGPRLNGHATDWSLLTEASRLWTLPAGASTIVAGTTGTTGATSIVTSWQPRYLTP